MILPMPVSDRLPPDTADRTFCGWRVRSAVPLPDLPVWSGDGRAPDLCIELGPVPDRLPGATVERPLLQVGGDGACRFAIRGVAAWWVAPDGRRVVMAPDGDPDRADVRTFLLGSVIAIVCMRRSLLPLHACCLERGGAAVAVCGHTGAGKSTLAAMLVGRGFRLLADDLTVVDMATAGATALPTFPRIKLWRDVLDRLGLPAEGLERVRPDLEKYNRPVIAAFCAEPRPLKRLLVLDPDTLAAGTAWRRLTAMEALGYIDVAVYRRRMTIRLGMKSDQMARYMALLSVTGGAYAVRRPESEAELDALVAFLDGPA
jgi:hypothetical protein